jgi:hypothetical protein
MVLILLGRKGQDHVDRGNSFFWELLSRCFAKLVLEVQSFASILEKGFWDNLFDNYRETVDEEMAKENKQVTLGGRRKMKRERERESEGLKRIKIIIFLTTMFSKNREAV